MAIKKISANLLGGNAVTAASIAGGAISAADIADNSITAAKISTSTFAIDSLTVNTSDLVVDTANNRVGIGTDSPSHNLTVGSTSPTDFVIALRGGVGGFFGWDDSANTTIVQAPNTRSLSFQVNSDTFSGGTEAIRIASSGNVGIGTDDPAYKLEVESSSDADLIQIQSTAGANNTVLRLGISGDVATLNASGNSSGALAIKTYGTERMRIDSSGTMILQADGAANLGRIQFSSQATTYQILGGNNLGYMGYKTGGYHRFFGSDGVEDMRIDSSGKVGIGNTSPASFYSGADNLVIGSTSENYNGLTIATSNIGTGRIFFADPDSTTVGQIEYLHTANVMLFATAAEESMRIDSSGNLLHSCTGTSGSAISDGGILLRSDSTNYMQISSGSTGASDLILFYKKSGTGIAGVGGISTFDGEVHFGRNTAGIMPIGSGTAPRVVPTSFSSGTLADGTVTLGDGSARWKDFYMAGDMNVGSQTSNIVPANRKAWFQGGGSYFTSYSAGQSTITTDASGLIVGTPSTRDGNANRYMAGISFDHLLNYSTTGNVTYNTYPHAWIGLKTYDFPGHERSSLVLATRNDVSGSGPTAEQLVISPYGEITMPNQPSARFYCSSGASVTSETVINSANTGATEYFDRNGDYNASTGEFSCPVNGVYLAYAYSNFTGSTNPGYLLLQYYNGSSWVNYAISYKSDTGSWNSVTLFTTIEANAGIMLRFVYNGDPDAGFHWFYGGWHLLA